jgi:hypothetical protein
MASKSERLDGEKSDEVIQPVTPRSSSDEEKAIEQPNLKKPLDWDGPDDPGNPWNWSHFKRVYHIIPPALVSFSAYVLSLSIAE